MLNLCTALCRSCAALCTGAAEVTLLDREHRALQCALLTAAAAGLDTKTSAADFSKSKAEAVHLREAQRTLQAHADKSSSCMLSAEKYDWNDEFIGAPYDVVIACDVLYESAAVAPVASLLPAMLAGRMDSERRLLLTDPQNRTPKHREKFLELLAAHDKDLVVDFVRRSSIEHPTSAGALTVIALRRKMAGDTIGRPLSSIEQL